MRGKWLLAAGAAILLALAAGALSRWVRSHRTASLPATAPQAAPAPFTAPEVSLPGKIRARQVIPVAAPVEGVLEVVEAEPGQEVYQGQLLARIKNVGLQAAQQLSQAQAERAQSRVDALNSSHIAARLEASRARSDASRAQTDFDRAEKTYLRQQMLHTEGATPRLVFEKAQKEFELARAQQQTLYELAKQAEQRAESLRKGIDNARRLLEESNRELDDAQQDLAGSEIRSPVDGILVARARQAGEEVTREVKDLFQIATELTSLEAVVEPEPPVLARIHAGQEAAILMAELPQVIPGLVREIKAGQVIVEFASPGPAVRPGLSAQVRIKLK
jgi:HlyD family secretion protein